MHERPFSWQSWNRNVQQCKNLMCCDEMRILCSQGWSRGVNLLHLLHFDEDVV